MEWIKGIITKKDKNGITILIEDERFKGMTPVPFWETPLGKAYREGRLAIKVTQDGAIIYETRPSD